MKYYPKVKKYIRQVVAKTKYHDEFRHFVRTVYWIKRLYPKADEPMMIAALAHDLERAFRKQLPKRYFESKKGFLNKIQMKLHSEKGAAIIGKHLRGIKAPEPLIAKVTMMISRHEVGGNKWQNLLRDADSISYFENQAKPFLRRWTPLVGRDKVEDKVRWMYSRISSNKARALAKPMYRKFARQLDNYYSPGS